MQLAVLLSLVGAPGLLGPELALGLQARQPVQGLVRWAG